MRKPIVVIKLGGSALTDKSKIYTPRKRIIRRAATQIASITRKRSVILIHGAGSYGHIPVKRYGLTGGFRSSAQLKGLAITKSKLLEWEATIDKILLEHGVPIVPFITSDFLVAKYGRIFSAEIRPIQQCLHLGCVPSAGGDIVMDLARGFSILSGDQLAAYLAVNVKASCLVFGVDVDGVFDANPKLNPHARLLDKLNSKEAMGLVGKATAHTAIDVTGGMAGKVREAVVAARHGIPVHFVNLTEDSRLLEAALTQHFVGSRITPG